MEWEKTSKKNDRHNNMKDDPLEPPQKYEKKYERNKCKLENDRYYKKVWHMS